MKLGLYGLGEANKRGFTIKYNAQLSRLGDGKTLLPSVGDINKTFYRKGWSVTFQALVTRDLHAAFVEGTIFVKDKHIFQDLVKNVISLHGGKHKVMDTKKESIMPFNTLPQVCKQKLSYLEHFKKKLEVLMPGQTLQQKVKMQDNNVVLVVGWHSNTTDCPGAQLCRVQNGEIELENKTQEPIMLGRKGQVNTLKVTRTEEDQKVVPNKAGYYKFNKSEVFDDNGRENIKNITFGAYIKENIQTVLTTT